MQYKYLSQEDQDDVLIQALINREKEHHNYEINRLNYLAMIAQLNRELPADYPEELAPYRTMAGEQLAMSLNEQEFAIVHKLQFRDRLKVLLQTTIAEQEKVARVYSALETALPEGERRATALVRVREVNH